MTLTEPTPHQVASQGVKNRRELDRWAPINFGPRVPFSAEYDSFPQTLF